MKQLTASKNVSLMNAFPSFVLYFKMLFWIGSSLASFSIPSTLCSSPPVVWNGVTYDTETVAKLITVITSTSPVPSIPSTRHLYPAQASLFQIPAFALCKKIIVFDGIRPGQEAKYGYAYGRYKD